MCRNLFYLLTASIIGMACSTLPDADFYEVEGIVSISARSLSEQNNWKTSPYYTSVSMVSVEDTSASAGTLTFPFYIRTAGQYAIWVLSKAISPEPEKNILPFRVMTDDGFLLDRFSLGLNQSDILSWQNQDHRSGNVIVAEFQTPGHYRVVFESGGNPGYVVDKIHLTLNNLEKPAGMGLPETINPGTDPKLAKREQIVVIPPAWLFGPFCSQKPDQPGKIYIAKTPNKANAFDCRLTDLELLEGKPEQDQPNNLHSSEEAFLLSQRNDNGDDLRGLIFAPVEHLHHPGFKKYPTLWNSNIEAGFRDQIEMIANPGRSTYEVPFLVNIYDNFAQSENRDDFSEEMFLRWVQFSTFNTAMYIPFVDSETWDAKLSGLGKDQLNRFIRLRNKLFPYVYSNAHLIRSTGVKPVRGDGINTTQYTLGEAFLVAPVYEEDTDERLVYFPDGTWYDYWDGTAYEGGQSWFIEAPLTKIPVFVKAGSIIPYHEYTGSAPDGTSDRMTIEIYGGGTGTFRLYEDDGITTYYQRGEFATTAFRYFEHNDYATFTIGRMVRGYEGQSPEKELTLTFKYIDEPISITANEEILERGEGSVQWRYDENSKTLMINWDQPNDQKTDFRIEY